MSEQAQQPASDEIDLGVIFKKIKSFFKSFLVGIIKMFQFFWRHKFNLIILLVIGIGLKIFLNSNSGFIFSNQFLVKPNYGSTEYVYSKVNAINSKLKGEEDTLYLKEIFGQDFERVKEVEMTPVIDVYKLVNKSKANRETFRLLLSEHGDISFLEDEINIKEYPTHKIKIYIQGKEDNELIATRLYDHLANNSYYNDLKASTLENLNSQLAENKRIRQQIDSIVIDQKGNTGLTSHDNNSIIFSGSQDLKDLLDRKNVLLRSDLKIKLQLSSKDEVLKVIDSSFGVNNTDHKRPFFLIPIALLGLYCFIFFAIFLSKRALKLVNS